jgi:hypothetical protein
MLQRCENPKNAGWPLYGAKGITVCERWHTFAHFLADMGERPGKQYSLDRKNGALGYVLDNCQWATPQEQHRNKSNNRLITFEGKTSPLVVWAERIGLSWPGLRWRLEHGWSVEEAVTIPPGGKRAIAT